MAAVIGGRAKAGIETGSRNGAAAPVAIIAPSSHANGMWRSHIAQPPIVPSARVGAKLARQQTFHVSSAVGCPLGVRDGWRTVEAGADELTPFLEIVRSAEVDEVIVECLPFDDQAVDLRRPQSCPPTDGASSSPSLLSILMPLRSRRRSGMGRIITPARSRAPGTRFRGMPCGRSKLEAKAPSAYRPSLAIASGVPACVGIKIGGFGVRLASAWPRVCC